MNPEKCGWRVVEWARATGVSRAYVHLLIRSRKIASVKSGAARIITTPPRDYLAVLGKEAA